MKNKIIVTCDRTVFFSFCILIYFLPIANAIIEICSSIIITAFFTKRLVYALAQGRASNSRLVDVLFRADSWKFPQTPFNRILGLFLLWNLLSVIFSQFPFFSLKAFVFKLFQAVILFFSFVESVNTKKRIRIFISIFLISGCLVLINGVVQNFSGRGFLRGHLLGEGRVMSSFKHANDYGAYLIFLSLLFWGFAGMKKMWPAGWLEKTRSVFRHVDWARIGFWGLFFVALINVGWTYSRGVWGGIGASLLFWGLCKKRVIPALVVLYVIFIIIFVPRLASIRNVTFLTDDISREKHEGIWSQSYAEDAGGSAAAVANGETRGKNHNGKKIVGRFFSGMGRDYFWERTVRIVQRYPAFGIGLNSFAHYSFVNETPWFESPHNCYLQMAAETGILGLAIFSWFLVMLFSQALKMYPKIKEEYFHILLLSLLAGLFGFMAHSFFDTNFYSLKLGNLMWIMFGAVAAIPRTFAEDQGISKKT